MNRGIHDAYARFACELYCSTRSLCRTLFNGRGLDEPKRGVCYALVFGLITRRPGLATIAGKSGRLVVTNGG